MAYIKLYADEMNRRTKIPNLKKFNIFFCLLQSFFKKSEYYAQKRKGSLCTLHTSLPQMKQQKY